MTARHQDGERCFEDLITRLRADGHGAMADRFDDLLHRTAWTTGSELLGELGLALRDFRRSRPTMSHPLQQLVRTCARRVGRVWPGLRR
jgi:hypothetical protein